MEIVNKSLVDNSNNNVSDLSHNNVSDLSKTAVQLTRVTSQQTRVARQQPSVSNTSDLQVRSVETIVNNVITNEVLSKIVSDLTNDPKFLARVDESVKKMLADGKLDSTDIPEIVFLIMDAYNTFGSVRVSKEDLCSFVKLIFEFVVDKYKLLPSDKLPEYESMLISSVKLVLLTPQVDVSVKSLKDNLKRLFFCC